MIKKTIVYTDYEGKERKEDFYFNLSEAELLELQMSSKEGFANELKKVIAREDQAAMMALIKELILKSYGVKSDDGKRFIKSKSLSEEFSQMPAFSELFTDLLFDDDKAAAFITGIIPSKISSNPEYEETIREERKKIMIANSVGSPIVDAAQKQEVELVEDPQHREVELVEDPHEDLAYQQYLIDKANAKNPD